jgi:hypothetical protein
MSVTSQCEKTAGSHQNSAHQQIALNWFGSRCERVTTHGKPQPMNVYEFKNQAEGRMIDRIGGVRIRKDGKDSSCQRAILYREPLTNPLLATPTRTHTHTHQRGARTQTRTRTESRHEPANQCLGKKSCYTRSISLQPLRVCALSTRSRLARTGRAFHGSVPCFTSLKPHLLPMVLCMHAVEFIARPRSSL